MSETVSKESDDGFLLENKHKEIEILSQPKLDTEPNTYYNEMVTNSTKWPKQGSFSKDSTAYITKGGL